MSLLKALVLVAGQIVQLPTGDTVGDFNTLANKPTTIAGYGITAASVLSTLLTVDGAGSGLDADLLDGNSSAFFLDLGNATGNLDNNRVPTGSLPLNRLANASATSKLVGRITAGAGAWEELTGAQGLTITGGLAASSYTAADVLAKLVTVDGAGSGLDADLLDGLSSAAYAQLAVANIFVGDQMFQKAGTPSQGLIYLGNTGGRSLSFDGTSYLLPGTNLLVGGSQVWTASNDGAGSGMDADLLDGLSSAAFAQRGAVNVFVGDQTVERSGDLTTGLIFFGNSGSRYLWMDATTFNFVGVGLTVLGATVWTSGNDGAGSGLDADLLDGLSSASFMLASNTTFASLTVTSNNSLFVGTGAWVVPGYGHQLTSQNAAYTYVLGDAGNIVRHNSATAHSHTIPPNSSVAFPLGTQIRFANIGAGNITIARGAGVALFASGVDGNVTFGGTIFGFITKVNTDTWCLTEI